MRLPMYTWHWDSNQLPGFKFTPILGRRVALFAIAASFTLTLAPTSFCIATLV
ncbi:hypothetical protein C8R43DRAFT_1141905 [Mycena crocata]|nr:hypothetical protein C8R43DRAFT_1141905 [Mycena crocata]